MVGEGYRGVQKLSGLFGIPNAAGAAERHLDYASALSSHITATALILGGFVRAGELATESRLYAADHHHRTQARRP
jgi:hypothetical protein